MSIPMTTKPRLYKHGGLWNCAGLKPTDMYPYKRFPAVVRAKTIAEAWEKWEKA